MNRHIKILNYLVKIAEDVVPVSHARLCAAIVIKNEIVALGTNSLKSHPFQRRFGKSIHNIFLHAEIDAIKNFLKRYPQSDLAKATLYVARSRVWKILLYTVFRSLARAASEQSQPLV